MLCLALSSGHSLLIFNAALTTKERIHEIIFEADTKEGKFFDVAIMILIVLSVIVASLETVSGISLKYGAFLYLFEWIITIIFTLEYALRIYSSLRPKTYIYSFFGIVDLLSIIPTYLSLIVAGSQSLMIIRSLRLLRIFRVFKMAHYVSQSRIIILALRASKTKITVFLYFILLSVCVFGSIMYLVEGGTNSGFDSIPRSIYWAIVTLTTVGFGDIIPVTILGQFLSSILMILGYAVLAVPTGIVTTEFMRFNNKSKVSTAVCHYCSKEGHDVDAKFCKFCGNKL